MAASKYPLLITLNFRTIEDYAVVYLGSALFKIARLLIVAAFTVHMFACIFFFVKANYAASQEDVMMFYTSRGIAENVSSRQARLYLRADF